MENLNVWLKMQLAQNIQNQQLCMLKVSMKIFPQIPIGIYICMAKLQKVV